MKSKEPPRGGYVEAVRVGICQEICGECHKNLVARKDRMVAVEPRDRSSGRPTPAGAWGEQDDVAGCCRFTRAGARRRRDRVGARRRRTGARLDPRGGRGTLRGRDDPRDRRGAAAARGDERDEARVRGAHRHRGRDRDVRALRGRQQGHARPQLAARTLRLHPAAAPRARPLRRERPSGAARGLHGRPAAAQPRLQARGRAVRPPVEGDLLVRRQGVRLPVHRAHHVHVVPPGSRRGPEGEGRVQGQIRLRAAAGAELGPVSRPRGVVHAAGGGALRHRAAGQAARGAVVRVAELPLQLRRRHDGGGEPAANAGRSSSTARRRSPPSSTTRA